jgi:hypothetical protein
VEQSSSYTFTMIVTRFAIVLLLLTCVSGQESSTPQIGQINTPVPKLPVIDHNACPGKNQTVPNVKIPQNGRVYASHNINSTLLGTIRTGQKVTVLEGVNVIRKPDKAVIKYVYPNNQFSPLKVGDIASSYGVEADGNVVFWAKGVWFAEDIEAVGGKGECGFTSGFGQGGCTVNIVEDGASEWWVKIKTNSGLTGWVLAAKSSRGEPWGDLWLCHTGKTKSASSN